MKKRYRMTSFIDGKAYERTVELEEIEYKQPEGLDSKIDAVCIKYDVLNLSLVNGSVNTIQQEMSDTIRRHYLGYVPIDKVLELVDKYGIRNDFRTAIKELGEGK